MMVEEVPSGLVDRMCEGDIGLPSVIQAGSIGRSSRFTLQCPASINARDICLPHGINRIGRVGAWIASKDVRNGSSRLLILSYAGLRKSAASCMSGPVNAEIFQQICAHEPIFPGCDKMREATRKEERRCPSVRRA